MIQFTNPGYLILLPPLVYLAWRLSQASLADLPGIRKRVSLGIRIAIISALVLAISGIQIVRPSRHMAVVFALDVSDSVSESKRQAALDYIREAAKNKRENDYIGLIVFGADASVEIAPETVAAVDRIHSVPSRSYTDIAQALGLAMASMPEDASKRIVLISDGNENLGKALDQAVMAESGGITIDTLPIANDIKRETLLDKMITPAEVKIGEPFELKLVAVSKGDAHARVRLLRDGRPVGQREVSLQRGKSVLAFPQTIDRSGVYSFQALLESDSDTMLDNNRAIGTTMVRGKPKVLYVEGNSGQGENLAKSLRASDIDVEVKGPGGIPISLDELRNYDSVLFCDVPATAMGPDQMSMIQAGCRDLGVGFGMIGGDNSFGAGGYFNTPIEATLPVDMSIRKQKVVPSLSVVVVIDKSGSMAEVEGGRTKISLANEAAINVVQLLQPIDKIGVIFCHDYPVTIVPLQNCRNKSAMAASISTVNAEGGGITVFPSLKAAYQMIASSGTRQKHVIMMCDGNDCDEPSGCVPLAALMNKKGITVTSVAFGEGKDVLFMKQMAAAGGGNFYLARKARELPYIFTKDVMLVSKTLIVEEPFQPRVDPSSPVLAGIDWKSMPPLLGYVATSAKSMAEVPIQSHKEDPIYAQWQLGLGRSIAFTSDAKPKWAVRWLGWPGFGKFWSQAVRWSMRKTSKADFQSTVDIDQAVGKVVIDAVDKSGGFVNFLNLEGRAVLPDMTSVKLNLQQTAPGRYEAEFPARQVGTFTVNVIEKNGANVTSQTSSVTIPYPPEYKDVQTNRRLLERIASTTGGKVGPLPADVFKPNVKSARIPTDIWWGLLLFAALLFPADVAIRRLAMDMSEVQELIAKMVAAFRARRAALKRAPKVERVETVSSLLKSKQSRKLTDEEIREERRRIASTPPTEPPKPTPAAVAPEKPKESAPESDTTSRLLEAKRRAREKKE